MLSLAKTSEPTRQPHTPTPPDEAPRPPSLIAILLIAVGALVALLVWSIPSWSLFVSVFPHFSLLWQQVPNRRALISLCVRIGSPLLIALLCASCLALWHTIKPYLTEPLMEVEDEESFAQDVFIAPANETFAPQRSQPFAVQGMQDEARLSVLASSAEPFASLNPQTPIPAAAMIEKDSVKSPETPLPLAAMIVEADSPPQMPASSTTVVEDALRLLARLGAAPEEARAPVSLAATPVAEAKSQHAQTDAPVCITLLKELTITLQAGEQSMPVPLRFNDRILQLIACVAWRREEQIRRGKLIEDIFGYGKDDSEATPQKLAEAFSSAKKKIRAALRNAALQLNKEAGQDIIDPHLDIFALDNEVYWLSRVCQVPDLEAVERAFRIIDGAKGQALYAEEVQNACLVLMGAYKGDLLENLVKTAILEEPDWEEHWLRGPFTYYRDCYLTALWCRAQYFQSLGESIPPSGDEGAASEQDHAFAEAAKLYQQYALYAINSRFDEKTRLGEAEHGLRYAFRMYVRTGNTHEAGLALQAFRDEVDTQFPEWGWKMSAKTKEAWTQVQQQTYAFAPLNGSTQRSSGE